MSLHFWKTSFALFAILQITRAWELVCYNGSINNFKRVSYQDAAELITSGCFNVERKVHIHASGYRSNGTNQGLTQIVNAHLLLGDTNVLAVDWTKEANLGLLPFVNFPLVAAAAERVAKQLAKALTILFQNGMKPELVHLSGLSLGAHLVAIAARTFKQSTNQSFARVTGFEPAKPGYEGPIARERIDQTCAIFVDVIHTDWERYGLKDSVGHVDFFVNPTEYDENGVQPGCPRVNLIVNPPLTPNDACSHRRSLNLYVDSMSNVGQLQGRQAASQQDWENGITGASTFIGPGIDQSMRGVFYLRTKSEPAYGLGEAGQTPLPTS